MKDLRTLLPSFAKEELKNEVSKRLKVLIDKHGITNYYGEIKTSFQINIGMELTYDYPYLNDMCDYTKWYREAFKEASDEAIKNKEIK
jgi:hypothetical protein